MKILENWREYNHALVPSVPPHVPLEKSDIDFLSERNLLRLFIQNHIFFAQYITDWDSERSYPMFYLIKDSFETDEQISSNNRRQRRKARENFYVQEIDIKANIERLFVIYTESQKKYPKENRTLMDFEDFSNSYRLLSESGARAIGAFDRESNALMGYKIFKEIGDRQINQLIQKIIPAFEKKQCATALQSFLCDLYKTELLSKQKYLCNGERSFRHKTNQQQFLTEHFYFRKAHCALHLRMCLLMKIMLACLMPFTYLLKKSHKKIFYDIGVVEDMWKTARLCREIEKNNKNSKQMTGGGTL